MWDAGLLSDGMRLNGYTRHLPQNHTFSVPRRFFCALNSLTSG